MPNGILIHALLSNPEKYIVIDVRTPAEFAKGHLPNAMNIPIFTNEERIEVGTLYVQQGRTIAIKQGLDFVGPKMRSFIENVEQLMEESATKEILVYCWRGGMRSGSMAWLFEMYGFSVTVLKGGYKAFRRFTLQILEQPFPFIILGGYTGSGKTHILQQLHQHGESVIDLEKLAGHKGSAFGWLGEPYQPTQEHFDNTLTLELLRCAKAKRIWLEDESRRIGSVNIPMCIWNRMRESPLLVANITKEQRILNLLNDYDSFTTDELMDSLVRLRERLGGAASKEAEDALVKRNLRRVVEITLVYYDKFYRRSMEQRENSRVFTVDLQSGQHDVNAEEIIQFANTKI